MKTINYFILLCISLFIIVPLNAQQSSFIVLGDMHHDRMEDHDFEWIKREKAGDLSQIEGYTANTKNNWDDFMKHLRFFAKTNIPQIKAVIQCGDLSEGLAGDSKADQMARNVMSAVDNSGVGLPWIIAKGNHDVTSGTPAKDAFNNHYIPMFRKQTGNADINSANYRYRTGDVEFFVCDYYERSNVDPIDWLDNAAKSSDAKIKFVVFHEPVIPVTERCWHMYRTDDTNRQRLLRVVASNKLIALVGHLHRYSVVRRTTEWGPIVQIMCSSVISDRNAYRPSSIITTYGPSIATNSSYEPSTLEARVAYLTAEQPYVTYYKQTSFQGFGLLNINEADGKIELKYYGGFSCDPYDTVDISALTVE
ncbi:MAG: metallophosphoesterase [Paludibacter sp.]|nr:metallophosphoesterase [Paludibacter sp.]